MRAKLIYNRQTIVLFPHILCVTRYALSTLVYLNLVKLVWAFLTKFIRAEVCFVKLG